MIFIFVNKKYTMITSVLCRIEDKTTNNSFILDLNYELKRQYKSKEKLCWFCQRPCFKFVSICGSCEDDKFAKKYNKNRS